MRLMWMIAWFVVVALMAPLYLMQGLIDWLGAPLSNAAAHCYKRFSRRPTI